MTLPYFRCKSKARAYHMQLVSLLFNDLNFLMRFSGMCGNCPLYPEIPWKRFPIRINSDSSIRRRWDMIYTSPNAS
jgi:hypothetical protein